MGTWTRGGREERRRGFGWEAAQGRLCAGKPPWIYRTAHTTGSGGIQPSLNPPSSFFLARSLLDSVSLSLLVHLAVERKLGVGTTLSATTPLYAMYQNSIYALREKVQSEGERPDGFVDLRESWAASSSRVRISRRSGARTVTHRRWNVLHSAKLYGWLSLRERHSVQRITYRLYAVRCRHYLFWLF